MALGGVKAICFQDNPLGALEYVNGKAGNALAVTHKQERMRLGMKDTLGNGCKS